MTGVFGVTLQWVRDNIAFAFNQEESEAKLGMDPYNFLCDCAAKSPAGSNGVIYRPSLMPIGGISTKGSFQGLTVTSNINDMIRATLEGLAYEARNGAELVAAATGIPIGDIYNCGGPSKSKLWNQIFADIFGKRIYTPGMDPDLTGCKGAAMFAGLGLGIYKDRTDAIKMAVSAPVPVDPIPENVALYQKEFEKFKAYLESNKNVSI
jgi:xylulokinase